MSSSQNSFSAYMKEPVSLSRWNHFGQFSIFLFLICAFAVNANAVIFDHPGRAIFFASLSLCIAFLGFVTQYWRDHYGEWTYIAVLLIFLIALFALIAHHEIAKRRPDAMRVGHSAPLANDRRPTTND